MAAAAVAFAPPALAQRALTLDEALQLARLHNRDLCAARARLDQSASSVDQARAALLPQVSAQGKYTHNYKDVTLDVAAELRQPVLGLADVIGSNAGNAVLAEAVESYARQLGTASTAPVVIQKGDQLDADLKALVPLFAPHARATLTAAKQAHAAQAANLAATEADVLLSVAQAFYAAAAADELVLARRNAIAVAKETLATAKARFQQGSATTVDTMRAEVALDRADQSAAEAEDVQARAYQTLATLLGTRESLGVVPSETAPPEPAAIDALVEDALLRRPELTFYQRSLDSATSSLHASSWRWSPTLSAFGDAQAFNYPGFSGDKYSWAVGLQLDWELFDGGRRSAERRLALAQRHEYQARIELLRDTVNDGVVNDRRLVGTKRRGLDTAVRARDLSRETLRVVRLQYEAGKALQLDLLQAQDSLVSAEVAVAQARFDLALADLQLSHDTGLFPSKASTQ